MTTIINCLFNGSDKAYGYLTSDKDIVPGDFVLVESNKPTDRKLNTGRPINILSTLEVVEINVQPIENIKYKPIIQKIDFTEYLKLNGEL